MTISGAYGRDYTSLKAAQADWDAGKDFIIRDLFNGDGQYINKEDAQRGNVRGIVVRYAHDRKVGQIK